jgi:hypothetical protein
MVGVKVKVGSGVLVEVGASVRVALGSAGIVSWGAWVSSVSAAVQALARIDKPTRNTKNPTCFRLLILIIALLFIRTSLYAQ